MTIKNLIFDFDGTLADTTEGIVRCKQATLREMGLPASTPERIRGVIGLPLRECFALGTDTPEERLDEACETYRRLFAEVATPRITLFPGVAETLAQLRSHGLRLSIATSRTGASLRELTARLDIAEHFCEMVATEDVVHPKPAPDLALLLLDRLQARAEETVVIGDTVFDLQMGLDAGCRTCGVTFGNQDRPQLQTASPDWIVDDFRELAGVLLAGA